MLTIPSKTTPANAISPHVQNLRIPALNGKEEIAVIGVDAVLHFRPQEDLDGLIIYIDSLAIFGHWSL